jgi:hypothetical protein
MENIMTRPIFETYTPATANTTFFAASVAGAAFTLTNNATSDSLAHQVTIIGLGATDLSGINVTLVGLGQDGNTQTETFALPNGVATVTSALYYKSLTSAVPASTIGAATVKIGFNNQFSSRTIAADWRGNPAMIAVVVSGTINYSVQYTPDDIQHGATRPYNWLADAGPVVSVSVNGSTTFNSVPLGFRFIANSYSAGATAKLTISQMNNNV